MVMKFLICGIGSIGQRHYKNLRALGHQLALYRVGGGANAPFIEKFLAEEQMAGRSVVSYHDFDQALAEFEPDAVLVTNPNSKHAETALRAARAGKHLFIEKPLSHTWDGVEELIALAEQKNLKVMIAYNLRWHPLLRIMKKMVENGSIGEPLSAHVEMGENIEDWHPWENYRETYAAYQRGGGGAVLCFSHDIDYLYWFFGKPENIFTVGGKITPLGGDAEDMIKAILEYKNKFIASLHLDYWQRPPKRSFEVLGTTGRLLWDYYAKSLTLYPHEKNYAATVYPINDNFDRNDMFIDEIKDFIAALQGEKELAIPLKDGIDVLEMSLAIKKPIGF
jgi:predicted dehydrogenase